MSKRNLEFYPVAWEHHLFSQTSDKKILAKLNNLLLEIQRDPFSGLGKPEPLRDKLSGYWSRRINDEHRLIYKVEDERILILSCRYHYSK